MFLILEKSCWQVFKVFYFIKHARTIGDSQQAVIADHFFLVHFFLIAKPRWRGLSCTVQAAGECRNSEITTDQADRHPQILCPV